MIAKPVMMISKQMPNEVYDMEAVPRVLVVDDVVENIQIALTLLNSQNYDLFYAMSGEDALELLSHNQFDLILLDIMMPNMDGYELCQRIQSQANYNHCPVIFLTARTDTPSLEKAFEVGGVDYIAKPFHSSEFIARVKTHLDLFLTRHQLEKSNRELQHRATEAETMLTSELEETQMELIHLLTGLMESTSDETSHHIQRVARHSRLLAHLHRDLSDKDAYVIYHAAPMHDIGKVFIPESILHKSGKLTDAEFDVMKTHTTQSDKLFRRSNKPLLKAASTIARQHHEKWDGTGYPDGLHGNKIHIYSRIVALADVFDALTHKRCYKPEWTIEKAAEFILQKSGTHFDPYLVKLFEDNLQSFVAIANE